jgi:hypothetical protein
MDDYKEINDLKNLSEIAIYKEKEFNKKYFENSNISDEIINNINKKIELKNKIREEIDIRYKLHKFYNSTKITNHSNFIDEYRSNEEKLLNLLHNAISILKTLLNLNNDEINTSEENIEKYSENSLDKNILKIL